MSQKVCRRELAKTHENGRTLVGMNEYCSLCAIHTKKRYAPGKRQEKGWNL